MHHHYYSTLIRLPGFVKSFCPHFPRYTSFDPSAQLTTYLSTHPCFVSSRVKEEEEEEEEEEEGKSMILPSSLVLFQLLNSKHHHTSVYIYIYIHK